MEEKEARLQWESTSNIDFGHDIGMFVAAED